MYILYISILMLRLLNNFKDYVFHIIQPNFT